MSAQMFEMENYKNFDEMAADVLAMAKEFFPDKLIYLTKITDNQQIILRLS